MPPWTFDRHTSAPRAHLEASVKGVNGRPQAFRHDLRKDGVVRCWRVPRDEQAHREQRGAVQVPQGGVARDEVKQDEGQRNSGAGRELRTDDAPCNETEAGIRVGRNESRRCQSKTRGAYSSL
jgi:hypothetical protein